MKDFERDYLDAVASECEEFVKQLKFYRATTWIFEAFAYVLPALQVGTFWFVYSNKGWTLGSVVTLVGAFIWTGVAIWLYVRNREWRKDLEDELKTQQDIVEVIRNDPEFHEALLEAVREAYADKGFSESAIDRRMQTYTEIDHD